VSTQINVTVGSGGLSDKAKQLQTAARQAQLEKERQQRIEAEGTEQRNAKLEAEGKAPDGSPLYNVPFNQPQIDRRPAAYRLQNVKLTTFYSNYLSSYAKQFFSGDGKQQAVLSLPEPESVDYPLLESDYPEIPTTGNPSPFSISGLLNESTYIPFDDSFLTGEETTVIKSFRKLRFTYGYQQSSSHIFPLGGDSALVVESIESASASVITSGYSHQVRVETTVPGEIPGTLQTTFSETLIDQSFTATLENNWVYSESWSAVIIGNTLAKSIEVPQALKDAIKTIVSAGSESIQTYTANSRTCLYAGTQFIESGDYSDRCFNYPPDWGYQDYVTYAQNGGPVVLTAVSPLKVPKEVAFSTQARLDYGVGAGGFSTADSSPAAWLSLESEEVANAMANAGTHEEFYSITTSSNITIGSLFDKRQMIDVTDPNVPKYWGGPSLSGDVFRVPEPESSLWRRPVKATALLEGFDVTYRVTDWGKGAFCSQQAAKYGITL
jgi:hypothetical protein